MNIAVFGKLKDRTDRAGIASLAACLREKGAKIWFYRPFADGMASSGYPLEADGYFHSESDFPAGTDLMMALGGDGTILTSLLFLQRRRLPVLGVNFGRLGFLTSVDGSGGLGWVDDLVAGRYEVENHLLLKLDGSADIPVCPLAINEVALQRKDYGLLLMEVTIDSRPLPLYRADGILVSTPAGSTAYSLSVGGPVVMPGSDVITITPIASHNLSVRPVVVPSTATVEVRLIEGGAALLSADNRSCTFPEGGSFKITGERGGFGCITFNKDNFISALSGKLFWGQDRRNNL